MRLAIVAIMALVVALFLQVVHRSAISLAESGAIIIVELAFHARVAVAVVIIRILVAVGFEIPPRRLYAIVEALPLRIAIFRGRFVPAALSLVLRL
jgi:hypothetical protein